MARREAALLVDAVDRGQDLPLANPARGVDEHWRMAAQLKAVTSSQFESPWSGVAESKHSRQVSRVSSGRHA